MTNSLLTYPKWVTADPSHLVNQGGHFSTPHFSEVHVDRWGNVKVLVRSADEESAASAVASIAAGTKAKAV